MIDSQGAITDFNSKRLCDYLKLSDPLWPMVDDLDLVHAGYRQRRKNDCIQSKRFFGAGGM